VQYDLRKKMFNHLRGLSFSYYDGDRGGLDHGRASPGLGRIAGLITWGLNDVFWALTSIASSTVFIS